MADVSTWIAVAVAAMSPLGATGAMLYAQGRREAGLVTREEFCRLETRIQIQEREALKRTEAIATFAHRGETALQINALEKNLNQRIDNLETRFDEGVDRIIKEMRQAV